MKKTETNFIQIADISDKDQFKMYTKCKKKTLAKMLIERGKPAGIITTAGGDLKYIWFDKEVINPIDEISKKYISEAFKTLDKQILSDTKIPDIDVSTYSEKDNSKPLEFPLDRIESHSDLITWCPICKSNTKRQYWIFGKRYCVNPLCIHYEIPVK
jgi:hypothetical protein